jgi:hypothetical protein
VGQLNMQIGRYSSVKNTSESPIFYLDKEFKQPFPLIKLKYVSSK